jgi:hypothetical protein
VYFVFNLYVFTTFGLSVASFVFCRAEAGAKLATIRTVARSSVYIFFLQKVLMSRFILWSSGLLGT